MSYGACTCSEYPDGTLAIWDGINGQIDLYEGPISSTTTTTATLSPAWGRDNGGMTFDPGGNLWVTDASGSSSGIYEYSAPLTTGESPSVTIAGSNTGLNGPFGISYNQSTGNIYVVQSGKILVWSATASGNVAPSATISSSDIGNGSIKTDANYIYVPDAARGIAQFNLTASGSTSPNMTLLTGDQYYHFDFDVEGNLYPATGGTSNTVNRYLYEDGWNTFTTFDAGSVGTSLSPNVDDSGHVYIVAKTGSGGTNGPVYISNYNDAAYAPIVTLVGPSRVLQNAALYSPGKFNGDEPQ